MTRVFLCAGDTSGELHAAAFVRALRTRLPETHFLGLGGVEMEKAGVELVVHQRDLAVGGLVEVLSSTRRFVGAWRRLHQRMREERPDLLVLVDAPDFNIPFARRAHRAGIPVLYYVSPQVWAWRKGRVRKIARRVDRMAVIFPFEVDVYRGTTLQVDFVGHPLIDRMNEVVASHDREGARKALGLDPKAPLVVLLPGSRHNELRTGLAVQLDAARALAARRKDVRFVLGLAANLSGEGVESALRERGLRATVVKGRTYEAIRAADVALAKPGTVTVEVTLLDRPLVVVGRANPLTAAIMRRLVRVPSFTMPNLIAGKPVVPEFLQEEARPEAVALALEERLEGPGRDAQLEQLREVRNRLGGGGAADRAAAIAEEMVRGAPRS